MKPAVLLVISAIVLTTIQAGAQNAPSQPVRAPVAPAAAPADPDSGRAGVETLDAAVARIRENARRDAASPNPFPYAVATEPVREPRRRPVPCSTFARETDGTTTCIGVGDRASDFARGAPRASAPPKLARSRRETEPRVFRPVGPQPRLTDPRFDLPPTPIRPPADRDDGLFAFLGRVLSR